jgi:hypothetical protein
MAAHGCCSATFEYLTVDTLTPSFQVGMLLQVSLPSYRGRLRYEADIAFLRHLAFENRLFSHALLRGRGRQRTPEIVTSFR